MEQNAERIVLVVGMGTTPAVLTETVWALAHQEHSVIPDEIVVLCAASARDILIRTLLSDRPNVWDDVVGSLAAEGYGVEGRLVFGKTSVMVIPDGNGDELWDLRSGEDNLRAADFMLRVIRQYTESPDTVVLASIAGGRKTMSALLFSCMSLLGREQDRVYHVLPPEGLEGGTEPPLFFPKKGTTYRSLRTGRKIRGERIRSELFEVPFVRMRGWYQNMFKTIPPSYRTLVTRVQSFAPPAVVHPEIEIDPLDAGLTVNGVAVGLSRPCFALLLLIACGCGAKDLHRRLCELHRAKGGAACDWLSTFKEGTLFADPEFADDLTKTMSNLRKKLKGAGFVEPEVLVPQRGNPVMFPLSKIRWRNRERFAELCGYPFFEVGRSGQT